MHTEELIITKLNKKVNANNVFQILGEHSDKLIEIDSKTLRLVNKANKKPRKKDANIDQKNTEGNIIDVRDVTKYFLNGRVLTKVLTGVSFTVKRGEYMVIYGKSGSGKSTLLNLLSGLDRASTGDVIVNEANLPYYNDNKLTKFRRNNVSFIFQSYNLLQNLTGYDNVMSGSYLQKDKEKRLDPHELFSEYELDEVKYKFPAQMSGGQQQRVSILRALAKNAEIIFADEPTGALDESTTKIVLQSLHEINKKYGTTIIMVSHDPNVEKVADKVIYLKNGIISKIKTNENPIEPKNLKW